MHTLSLLPRFLLAVVFASTATLKLVADPTPAALLSPGLLRVVAVAEFVLALGLASKWHARFCWAALAFAVLGALVVSGAASGRDSVPLCGCFGAYQPPLAAMSPFWAEAVCWHWREP